MEEQYHCYLPSYGEYLNETSQTGRIKQPRVLLNTEDGFFCERKDLPLLEVTTETGLWYELTPRYDCIGGLATNTIE